MFIAPDPVDTIERFAELSALLDDPHARRAALLSGVGLDERAWREIEERWMACLKKPGGQPAPPEGGVVPPPSPPRSARRAPNPLADTLDSPEGMPLRPALPFVQV
jgi:hypothetical protein